MNSTGLKEIASRDRFNPSIPGLHGWGTISTAILTWANSPSARYIECQEGTDATQYHFEAESPLLTDGAERYELKDINFEVDSS